MQRHVSTPPPEGQISAASEWAQLVKAAAREGLITEDAVALPDKIAIEAVAPDTARKEALRLLPLRDMAARALDALGAVHSPADVIEVRALLPGGGCAESYCGRLDVKDEHAAMLAFVADRIGRMNLYFGVNPRREGLAGAYRPASASDVVSRRGMVLDLDFKDAPASDPEWAATVKELRDLAPALIIATGNGYHVHLPFKAQSIEADDSTSVEAMRQAMAAMGADDMSDAPRIARLPFTVNLPTPSKIKRGGGLRLALPVPLDKAANQDRTPEDVATSVNAVAASLKLPGRPQGRAPTDSNRAVAAPDNVVAFEPFKLLMEGMPNPDRVTRDQQVFVAGAVRGATDGTGFETEARDLFLDWSARWAWGGDPIEDARIYDTLHGPRTGWKALRHFCAELAPELAQRVAYADAQAVFAAEPLSAGAIRSATASMAAMAAAVGQGARKNGTRDTGTRALEGFKLTPATTIDPAQIPPRRWLYGRSVIAGFISMLVAPGGTGKSSLALAEAVSMATGKTLFGSDSPTRELRVWMHCAEDPQDEQMRRLSATMTRFGLTDADLGGRLFLTSGRDLPLRLARLGRDGPEVVPGVVDKLVGVIRASKVDVLVMDPLGATHTLPENDNAGMNVLLAALREIADRTGAAIILIHHTSKVAASDMGAAGANAARGASALVDGARVVRQLARMSDKEARQFGIAEDDRFKYVRVDNGKANLAPAAKAVWCELVSVTLGNGTKEYPHGDKVGVAIEWTPPGPVVGTASELLRVQNAILNAQSAPRANAQARDWIGHSVAEVLGLDLGSPGTRAKDRTPEQARNCRNITDKVAGWLRDGGLVQRTERDPASGRQVDVIEVGAPAIFDDTHAEKDAA